jgi:hypothetical protein
MRVTLHVQSRNSILACFQVPHFSSGTIGGSWCKNAVSSYLISRDVLYIGNCHLEVNSSQAFFTLVWLVCSSRPHADLESRDLLLLALYCVRRRRNRFRESNCDNLLDCGILDWVRIDHPSVLRRWYVPGSSWDFSGECESRYKIPFQVLPSGIVTIIDVGISLDLIFHKP